MGSELTSYPHYSCEKSCWMGEVRVGQEKGLSLSLLYPYGRAGGKFRFQNC